MAINMVECGSCGEVVDAGNRLCPHCGAQLQRTIVTEPSGSFSERYRGTEYEFIPPVVPVPARRSPVSTLLVGIGVALIVVVAGLGAMWALQPGVAATSAPRVYAPTPTPTPAPTLPPQVSMAMAQLKDPEFSARIKVQSRGSWSSEVVGANAGTVIVNLDATVSKGNVSGKVTVANQLGYEFRVVDGQAYQRLLPSGKWAPAVELVAQARVLPLLDLTDAKQLQFVGEETLDGATVYHLHSTDWWNPDVPRVGLLENLFGVTPQTVGLDLYVATDGKPIRADYSVLTKAKSGKDVMTITTRYDFSDVGKDVKIPSPLASPSKK